MNWLISLLYTLTLTLLFCSCTRTIYEPVETVRTQTEEVVKLRTDTVLQSDTRLIYVNGDTTVIYRDRWRERTSVSHDTLYIERTDSVAVPYPVEKQLTRWQQAKVDYGGYALLVSVTVLCVAITWLLCKFRR